MIEIGIGLLIIAIGSFGQSSSYVPINKIRDWSWESFWLVQGIFAWLVFPYLGAMLAVPEGSTLLELWRSPGSLGAVIYGMLWGVGVWRLPDSARSITRFFLLSICGTAASGLRG